MTDEYSPEQLWSLYQVLPKELQEAIFSKNTADNIYDICERNNLEKEKIREIAKYIGYTLLGILPPEELEKTLKEKLALSEEKAKKINYEINQLIFFPLKDTLALIYSHQIKNLKVENKKETPEGLKVEKEEIKKPLKDIYREPIE